MRRLAIEHRTERTGARPRVRARRSGLGRVRGRLARSVPATVGRSPKRLPLVGQSGRASSRVAGPPAPLLRTGRDARGVSGRVESGVAPIGSLAGYGSWAH